MFARLGIEILVGIIVFMVVFLFFEKLLRSKVFNRLIKGTVPPPDTDEEVAEAFDTAVTTAEARVEENLSTAEKKRESADKLKKRLGKK